MSDPAKKIISTRPEYHQSAIQMYLKCGKQYFYRYILGMVIPPRAALTVGGAVDTAVTHNLTQKISNGADVPLQEVLDTFETDFNKRSLTTDWGGDDPGQMKDQGAKLVSAHHQEIAPKLDPVSVQTKFKIELDGEYDLGGTIDLVEKNDVVADTKTAKLKYDEDAVKDSIQAGLYDFAFEALNGRPAKAFRFDVLIKPTKTLPARTQQVESKVTPTQRQFLFDTIENVHKSIKAGIAMPAPEGSWWCSKEWCGYWSMCKGKNR